MVGGRINKANLDYRLKHPVLLPKEGHITHAIIRDHHEKVPRAGRGMTIMKFVTMGIGLSIGQVLSSQSYPNV